MNFLKSFISTIPAAFLFWGTSSLAQATDETLVQLEDLQPAEKDQNLLEFETWMLKQGSRSLEGILANIHPEGTVAGTVVASPSKVNPDYWFHWTRDAALVMDVIERWSRDSREALPVRLMKDYVQLSRIQQQASVRPDDPQILRIYGEPKFYVDGTPYDGPWGRPQNDGPALRALTLIRFANALLDRGDEAYVRQTLYDSAGPGRSRSVIKNDLEFVAHYWEVPNFDLWEETKGHHFYTRLAQYRSLVDGAKLARRLGDEGAAGFYKSTADAIAGELELHWSSERGQIDATRFQRPGREYKKSQLDMAIVLGALHADTAVAEERFFAPSDARVLATAQRIESSFQSIYGINKNQQFGTAIGRYPEDVYNGTGDSEGNPWFLTTLAMAELYYQAANEWEMDGRIPVSTALERQVLTKATGLKLPNDRKSLVRGEPVFARILADFRLRGDTYVARVRAHLDQETGDMAEQFNRHTGFQQGARDLTWSYAAFVTALRTRNSKN